MGGNLQAYALFLEEKYGPDILKWLEREKHQIIKNFPFEARIKEAKEILATYAL